MVPLADTVWRRRVAVGVGDQKMQTRDEARPLVCAIHPHMQAVLRRGRQGKLGSGLTQRLHMVIAVSALVVLKNGSCFREVLRTTAGTRRHMWQKKAVTTTETSSEEFENLTFSTGLLFLAALVYHMTVVKIVDVLCVGGGARLACCTRGGSRSCPIWSNTLRGPCSPARANGMTCAVKTPLHVFLSCRYPSCYPDEDVPLRLAERANGVEAYTEAGRLVLRLGIKDASRTPSSGSATTFWRGSASTNSRIVVWQSSVAWLSQSRWAKPISRQVGQHVDSCDSCGCFLWTPSESQTRQKRVAAMEFANDFKSFAPAFTLVLWSAYRLDFQEDVVLLSSLRLHEERDMGACNANRVQQLNQTPFAPALHHKLGHLSDAGGRPVHLGVTLANVPWLQKRAPCASCPASFRRSWQTWHHPLSHHSPWALHLVQSAFGLKSFLRLRRPSHVGLMHVLVTNLRFSYWRASSTESPRQPLSPPPFNMSCADGLMSSSFRSESDLVSVLSSIPSECRALHAWHFQNITGRKRSRLRWRLKQTAGPKLSWNPQRCWRSPFSLINLFVSLLLGAVSSAPEYLAPSFNGSVCWAELNWPQCDFPELDGFIGLLHIFDNCGRCAQCADRCNDKCENTVLLETQGPCGIVRRCRDDTVTHDTSVQGNCHTRNSWRHFRRKSENWNLAKICTTKMTCRGLRNSEPVESEIIWIIGQCWADFTFPTCSTTSRERNRSRWYRVTILQSRRALQTREVSIVRMRDSRQWVSYRRYMYSTFHSIGWKSSSSLCNLTASQTCQSNEDSLPSMDRPCSRWVVSEQTTRSPNVCCQLVW